MRSIGKNSSVWAVAVAVLLLGSPVFGQQLSSVVGHEVNATREVEFPIHGKNNPYFTGKTKTVDGVLLYEYKCVRGHTFWVRP